MKIKINAQALAIGLALLLPASPALAKESKVTRYEENETAKDLVARITAPTTEGAGIIIHVDEQYIYGITAKHVLYQQGKEVKDLKALFQPWPEKEFPVAVHRLHHEQDLAVFKADLRPFGMSRQEVLNRIPLDILGKSEDLDSGDELSAMGHSTAGAWLTPKKWVLYAKSDGNDAFLFEYSCPQGHSGGAVFDKSWRLVGMMIDEERPYCRALGISPILRIVQGWKLKIDLYAAAAPTERGSVESGKITVAVVDFDNKSTEKRENLGALAQDITSSSLYTLPGVTLVTRDRLDEIRKEMKLPDALNTGTGVSRVGKLLQADAIVTGSILRYDVERRVFEGYGTSALQDVFRMEIGLQVLDVDTGRVRFSKTFPIERTKQYPKQTSAPSRPIDLTSELLTALINEAQKDLRSALMQVAGGLGTANQLIAVPVNSRPAGADVILSGIYVCKTPCSIRVAPDVIHDIEVVMTGYEIYKRRIRVQPDTVIEASLKSR